MGRRRVQGGACVLGGRCIGSVCGSTWHDCCCCLDQLWHGRPIMLDYCFGHCSNPARVYRYYLTTFDRRRLVKDAFTEWCYHPARMLPPSRLLLPFVAPPQGLHHEHVRDRVVARHIPDLGVTNACLAGRLGARDMAAVRRGGLRAVAATAAAGARAAAVVVQGRGHHQRAHEQQQWQR